MKLADEGVTPNRPLRFDPYIARAREVVRGGTVGTPRTLELCWSFAGADATAAATELVDVACWLLDSGPASVYAVACRVAGPPLVKVNLLTESGAIAVIEVAGESDDLPTRSDLHLLATDGEIVHRIGNDDLIWSEGRAWPLPGVAGLDELRDQELAGEPAIGWNVAVSRALARSLATGETVQVGEGIG
jgi:predicted dehydrogenase